MPAADSQHVHQATTTPPSATLPLLALAIGAFAIGVTEFAPMGLLPVIAQGVDVSIPQAGLLVSAYASGVLVGAPLMTLALARLPRRQALILLMAIFTAGNLLSRWSPPAWCRRNGRSARWQPCSWA
jgi:DHA1 family inner membrane transport protein